MLWTKNKLEGVNLGFNFIEGAEDVIPQVDGAFDKVVEVKSSQEEEEEQQPQQPVQNIAAKKSKKTGMTKDEYVER